MGLLKMSGFKEKLLDEKVERLALSQDTRIDNISPDRVDWFNYRRLLESFGKIPPTEFENMYYERMEGEAEVVRSN